VQQEGVAGNSIPDIWWPISSQGPKRGPLGIKCRSVAKARAQEGRYHGTVAALRGPMLWLCGTEEGSYHGGLAARILEVVPVQSCGGGTDAIAHDEARRCQWVMQAPLLLFKDSAVFSTESDK
jgi:hypothetical protein